MASFTMRIDDQLKKDAAELFKNLGMDMTTAITMFCTQAVREQRLPFTPTMHVSNELTLTALAESDDILANPDKYKGYTDVDELMRDLLA